MKAKTNAEVAPAPSGQHTPGPWGVNGDAIFDSCGQRIGTAFEPFWRRGNEAPQRPLDVRNANARLIAAAPELLQCLRDLTGGLWIERAAEENWQISRMLNDARAAIAKAEGRGQ